MNMKRLMVIPAVMLLAVLVSGFTLAPPRYTVTMPPGGEANILYQLGADSQGPFAVTVKVDDTFAPLPVEWLNYPQKVKDDFTIRLRVPKEATLGNYSVWVSVSTLSGTVRSELRSRLLVAVQGPSSAPILTIPRISIVAVAVVLLVVIVWFLRRLRYR